MKRGSVSLVIALFLVTIAGGIIYFAWKSEFSLEMMESSFVRSYEQVKTELFGTEHLVSESASWFYQSGTQSWQVIGTPPRCPEPLSFSSPVEVSLASGVLYPGQIRGGDYKAHGGFSFDTLKTNEVEVRAAIDGYVLKASRYLEGGEIQYQLFYVNACGIMVMHDHLLVLSPKLQKVFDTLPEPKEGDSRTTEIKEKVLIEEGEVLATEVGHKKQSNVSIDFGVYDLRDTNGVVYNDEFANKHKSTNEYGKHALCWLDYLREPDKSIVKNLPPVDGQNGTKSDYCK
ncbi:hypothetical protein A2801_02660 [Candidatus Woesebacteria bacterium RIFCSPHIGHO2_01_FULL_41_10]|uniref:Uncharacterized protein n=1 Tax=Candidatus Woesebacteria bacterium RIFCSPHIGHO2_01_FULL_41_10 TaxID=1802500 RepID=A0A1F7YP71_9BACT|nr:MAG: hypothetical protein A2801_02660 [Candidatus Woesebacteria bacterium RIFCSPHIGHO2_01_FULL_41_10]